MCTYFVQTNTVNILGSDRQTGQTTVSVVYIKHTIIIHIFLWKKEQQHSELQTVHRSLSEVAGYTTRGGDYRNR